jgi:hypothetical protein
MAKQTKGAGNTYKKKAKVKRPGVHAKKKNSKLKASKNYRKKYNRQGKK